MKSFLSIIFVMFFLSIMLVYGAETFTPIFCNDYEFTCCGGEVENPIQTYSITDESSWTCPSYAHKCELTSDLSKDWYIGTGNCHPDTGSFCDGWICDSQSLDAKIMNPLDQIYLKDQCSNPSAQAQIKIIRPVLGYCGKSGSVGEEVTCGVPVNGADGCKFNPVNGVVYTSTSSLSGKQNTNSYVVPLGKCVLAFQSGDRHICGYKEESCSSNSDCTGHTYGNQECIGRTLQTYGCINYGKTVSEGDRSPSDNGWGTDKQQPSQSGNADFGKRCDITSSQPVQCCGDTDCGNNYFCDKTSFICKENVECKIDSDCGVSVQCDSYSTTIKKPICSSGKCTFDMKKVECCTNDNCQNGGYCDNNNVCKGSTGSSLSVPKSGSSNSASGLSSGSESTSSGSGIAIIVIIIILIAGVVEYYFYKKSEDDEEISPAQAKPTHSKNHCTECGHQLKHGAEFCTNCGKKV